MIINELHKFVIPEPNSGCWIWLGSLNNKGYGTVQFNRRTQYAHRAAYFTHVGPIPEGLELDHLCRNPACCNPSHLEPVTHAENLHRGSRATMPTCINGHELKGDNLIALNGRGKERRCKICHRERMKGYYHHDR